MKAIISHLTTIILLFAIIGISIIGGIREGKRQEMSRTREKLNTCIYAPTPVYIGDSLYLIRVYPLNINVPK